MARVLIAVPPLVGHLNPTLPLAAELQNRGHEVAWAGHSELLDEHLPDGARRFELPVHDNTFVDENWHKVRGLESVRFFYEHFCIPMAAACLQPLEAIVEDYAPDVIICDHQMIAGALVARRKHIPWVSSITTVASILALWDVLDEWVQAQMAQLQRDYSSDPILARPDFSPHACVVFSSRAFIGDEQTFDAPYHFVGPAQTPEEAAASRRAIDFPWDQLAADKRKVLISLGTVSRDRSARFYRIMMEALGETDLQVIMVAPAEFAENPPPNFIVRQRVPQVQLLPHMDAVVSHAGQNTVCETLYNGIPLVVAPIRDDQPVIAKQVVNAGAGVSIRFGKVSAREARAAVEKILHEASYRQGAARLRESFLPLGGSRAAADVIERTLNTPNPKGAVAAR